MASLRFLICAVAGPLGVCVANKSTWTNSAGVVVKAVVFRDFEISKYALRYCQVPGERPRIVSTKCCYCI